MLQDVTKRLFVVRFVLTPMTFSQELQRDRAPNVAHYYLFGSKQLNIAYKEIACQLSFAFGCRCCFVETNSLRQRFTNVFPTTNGPLFQTPWL